MELSNKIVLDEGYLTDVDIDLLEFQRELDAGECTVTGSVITSDSEYASFLSFSTQRSYGEIYYLSNIPVYLFQNGELVGWTLSGSDGTFIFEDIPKGNCYLEVRIPGNRSNILLVVLSASVLNAEQDIAVTVYKTLSLDSESETVKLYPQPVKNNLFVECPSFESAALITVDGKTILTTNDNVMPLREYPSGIYYIDIRTATSGCRKLIVKE